MKCLLSEMKCINRQEIVHHKFIYTNVFTTIAYLLSNYRRMRGIYLEAFSTAAPLFAFIYIFFFFNFIFIHLPLLFSLFFFIFFLFFISSLCYMYISISPSVEFNNTCIPNLVNSDFL